MCSNSPTRLALNPCSPGALAQVVGYALSAPAPPFPVFVLGYAINGFGLSLQVTVISLTTRSRGSRLAQDAGANGFVACLKDNAATKMGILHAVYGQKCSNSAVNPG